MVPALIELSLVDFPGNLLYLHTVAGTGQEVHYGFFNLHLTQLAINIQSQLSIGVQKTCSLSTFKAFFADTLSVKWTPIDTGPANNDL